MGDAKKSLVVGQQEEIIALLSNSLTHSQDKMQIWNTKKYQKEVQKKKKESKIADLIKLPLEEENISFFEHYLDWKLGRFLSWK